MIDELYWDSRVDASDIKAEVKNGKVKLEGTVPTYHDKIVVGKDAWNVPGVNWVDNRVSVKYGLKLPTDVEIMQSINDRFRWNPNLLSLKIDVAVKDGEVTLGGTVDSYWKKTLAESEAERVIGVVRIHNKVAVVPTRKYSDEEIGKDVMKALTRRNYVQAEDVDVKVKDGVVTLTGTVPSWVGFFAAANAANYTLGVKDVQNKLNIKN